MTKKLLEQQVLEMCQKYVGGCSTTSLGSEYGISATAINGLLKRRGVRMRRPSETREKIDCDYDFFEAIDSEEKAYWLGFIAADGGISRNYHLRVALAASDKEHLVKLKKSLKSQHNITTYVIKDRNYSVVSFYSAKIIKDLEQWGIVKRKTFVLKFPDFLPSKLLRHFCRGYVDGDGGFYIPKKIQGRVPTFSVTSCEGFIKGMQQYLMDNCNLRQTKLTQRNKQSEIYTLIYSGSRQVKKIGDFLYSDAFFYLDRKKVLVNSLPLPIRKEYQR